jgi:hypothetical protein
MNSIEMNTAIGFLSCTAFHQLARILPFRTPHSSNLITCSVFQFFFIARMINLYTMHLNATAETNTVLDYLCGYFLYDIGYLLSTTPFSFFIIHHGIGISLIHAIKQTNISTTLLPLCHAICIMIEAPSPFLNLLPFSKQTSYYPILLRFIYHLYFISRIILFPIASARLLSYLSYSTSLTSFFSLIYAMSLYCIRKMNRMVSAL